MTEFGMEVTGEREAVLRFEKFPAFAHDRLLKILEDLEKRLEAAVLADEPSRTGALRRLTGGRVYDHGDRIAAVVGVRDKTQSGARKAAALEYGSRGTAIAVRAHEMSLGHIWARLRPAEMEQVPAYSRVPNITARRFLRTPIDAMRAEALAQMQAAIDAAARDSAA